MSALGKALGIKNAYLAVSAAGAAFTLMASLVLFTVAHLVHHKYPRIAAYLNCAGVLSVISEACYAFTAILGSSLNGHDFNDLKAGGISPWISIAILIGVPLIFKGMLMLTEHIVIHLRKYLNEPPQGGAIKSFSLEISSYKSTCYG